MIAQASRFGEESARYHVASDWLRDREPVAAVREILTAAGAMNSSERIVAIHIAQGIGDSAVSVWREMAAAPCVGPHAAMLLWEWDQRDDVPDAAVHWLAVEQAAVAVAKGNPDEALTVVSESLPGDGIDDCLASAAATGHPEADAVARAVADFAASGAPRSIDTVLQVKVALSGFRPVIWRSVRLPAAATLADLHYAIQALFGWDGDHLYVFAVGRRHYSGTTAALSGTLMRRATTTRSGSPPRFPVSRRSGTRMTSARAGSTRSPWRRRCRTTRSRSTRSASRSPATPRSSTRKRITVTGRRSQNRSTSARSTAAWPGTNRNPSKSHDVAPGDTSDATVLLVYLPSP
jgi:hypothetical protein